MPTNQIAKQDDIELVKKDIEKSVTGYESKYTELKDTEGAKGIIYVDANLGCKTCSNSKFNINN